ncbi:peptidyl-tRNA hydrolase II domain-containing protein [Zopfochytrium polystomum]|nr:peptidyl-tRNA hydrolase II domain-containing protein [Zopfochytrium polystomum]
MGGSLTMFVVIRKDLSKVLGWPTGSIIAQGAHAATSVIWTHASHPNVVSYMHDIENMHKVILETKTEASLAVVGEALKAQSIPFVLWTEQPENTPTCLATIPCRKEELGDALKKCSLYRG